MAPSNSTLTLPSGRVISRDTADAAADWLTALMSGEVDKEQRKKWRQWREANADHEAAWQYIESITGRMRSLGPSPAYMALSFYGEDARTPSAPRRRAIRTLVWGGLVTGFLASRTTPWQASQADYQSATGEQRHFALEDGTQLLLNTNSAVNLRFDARARRILLLEGEIMVTTRHEPGFPSDPRPLLVETAEGSIRSLGTRFTVRQRSGSTDVAVQESAIEIVSLNAAGGTRLLRSGEQTQFSRERIEPPRFSDEQSLAWTRGQLLANEQRLDDFLAELGRYRQGMLRVDPQVAGLRLSGVFPLADTDRILATLPSVLPVRVHWRTRYWATVIAAN